jgi:hypothetical protein
MHFRSIGTRREFYGRRLDGRAAHGGGWDADMLQRTTQTDIFC